MRQGNSRWVWLVLAGLVGCTSEHGVHVFLEATATLQPGAGPESASVNVSVELWRLGDGAAVHGAVIKAGPAAAASTVIAAAAPDSGFDYVGTFTGLSPDFEIAVDMPEGEHLDDVFPAPPPDSVAAQTDPSGLVVTWTPYGEADSAQVDIIDADHPVEIAGRSFGGDPGMATFSADQLTWPAKTYRIRVERLVHSGAHDSTFEADAFVDATTTIPALM